MRYTILPPTGNTRSPLSMEALLNSMHKTMRRRSMLSLSLKSNNGSVGYEVELEAEQRVSFLQELQDAYPGTIVKPSSKVTTQDNAVTLRAEFHLCPDLLPIKTFDEFVDLADDRLFVDPISGLLASIRSGGSGRIRSTVELSVRPIRKRRLTKSENILRRYRYHFRSERIRKSFLRLSTSRSFILRRLGLIAFMLGRKEPPSDAVVAEKTDENLFECWLTAVVRVPSDANNVARRKLSEIAGAYGRFTNGDAKFRPSIPRQRSSRQSPFLLSAKEVATLWHPVTESGDTVSRVTRPEFREVEPPLILTSRKGTECVTVLGRVKFRQQRSQFGISTDDLRRHMLAIGKTGCGKSTFLLNIVRQQIEAKRGVVLIDPHGQLADDVLDVIPKSRTNDVILFDASDDVAPVGFNPMVGPAGTDPTLIADGVLTSFKNVFGFDDGSAPRLLHIFRNSLLSLIGTRHATLSDVQRLLVDSLFRKSVTARVSNVAVREFWLTEFNRWNERDRTQYVASLQNKLGAFTTNERLQRILNCDQKGIQLRETMDESKILICNLSKGSVGHDASTLLGSLMLSSLQIAAMSRSTIPEPERKDCVVVVDEFHSYLSDGNSTMADALAESRKYRTSYVLSTQMLEQLDTATLAGVLGNCGSTMCMTVGPRDAEILAELLGSGLTTADLMRIPKYHAYLRLLIDGAPHAFSMTTLPSPRYNPNRRNIIRKVSRQRSGQSRVETARRAAG